jgi:hypothetical protein
MKDISTDCSNTQALVHAPVQLYHSQSVERVQDNGEAFWVPYGHVKLGLRFDVSNECCHHNHSIARNQNFMYYNH